MDIYRQGEVAGEGEDRGEKGDRSLFYKGKKFPSSPS